MENDYRMMNIVSVEMDRDAAEADQSTLSNSLESGLTVESSRGDAADSKLDECGDWTNEKHNSYLNYLENSFVKQLYSFLGGETQGLSRTRDVQFNSRKSTDQFKVLQNGCWQKVNFGKKRACLETSSEFRSQKNSSSSNLAKLNEVCTMGTAVQGKVLCSDEVKHSGDKAFTKTSMRNSVAHAYPTQSIAEASGQNFQEEEDNECDSEVTRKRKRGTHFDDSSLNDQVVP